MPSLESVRDGVIDESLRVAILAGLATVPFTLLFSWGPLTDGVAVVGESISGTPLLLAGLFVGYHYAGRETETRRAGIWTGLTAAVGVVLVFLADAIAAVRTESLDPVAIWPVFLPLGAVVGVVFTVLVTTLIATVAGWVRTRLEPDRRVVEEPTADGPNAAADAWRRFVAAYALVAPLAVALMWVDPRSGVPFALTFLVLFVTVPLAVLALVGIFVDATAAQPADAERIPNAVAYAGFPAAVYVLVSAAASLYGVPEPSAVGGFGFVVALWLAAIVYLASRRRASGTLPAAG